MSLTCLCALPSEGLSASDPLTLSRRVVAEGGLGGAVGVSPNLHQPNTTCREAQRQGQAGTVGRCCIY